MSYRGNISDKTTYDTFQKFKSNFQAPIEYNEYKQKRNNYLNNFTGQRCYLERETANSL